MAARLAPLIVYSNIFLVMLGLGVIGPNLTDIRREFDVSYGTISWGVSAFAFARLFTNLPAGIAAGRFPRLPLLMAGTLCVAAGGVIAALSTSVELFIVARAAQGIGSSISTTVGLTIVLDGADPTRRGRASGTFHSALGGGALFGPGFGALLSTMGGWRLALGGTAGAALVSFALIGMVLWKARSAPGLAPVADDEDEATAMPHLSPLALIFGAAFVGYLAAFAIFFVRGGVQQTVVPLMGRDEIGLSVVALSLLLMSSAAIGSALGPFVGGLSDRVGRSRVLLPGLAALALGVGVISLSTNAPMFIAGVLLISVAGTSFSIPSSMIVDAVGSAQRSSAIGVYRVVGDSAFTLAPFVSGVLVDKQGFAAAGLGSAAVVVVALAVAWRTGHQRARAKPVAYSSGVSEDGTSAT